MTLTSQLFSLAHHLSRLPVLRRFAGAAFTRIVPMLPLKYLRETPTLLAFFHPKPSYPFHVVLAPRRAVASLANLTSQDGAFLLDLVQAVQSLVEEYGLEKNGYRLVANGGKYQDFPQLHFHLISEEVELSRRLDSSLA